MILRYDLTLLNINTSKNSTFSWFFSLKSLYFQWLFVPLQHENPSSLSTMLKCAGRFLFIHFWIWRILFPLQNGLNPRKISLIYLNLEVYRFETETKPYNMKTLIFFLIFIISTLCCYSQTSMTGAPRQFAAPRASFNDIISIGELIKSVKEGNVGINPSLTLWGNFHKFLVIFSS